MGLVLLELQFWLSLMCMWYWEGLEGGVWCVWCLVGGTGAMDSATVGRGRGCGTCCLVGPSEG